MLLNFKWTPVYHGNTALEQVLPFVILQPAWPETFPPGAAPQGQSRLPQNQLHQEQAGEILPLLPQGKCMEPGASPLLQECLAQLSCVSGLDSTGCTGQHLFLLPGSAGQLSHADKQLYDNADYVNAPVLLSFLVLPTGASIFWCVSRLLHSTCCLFQKCFTGAELSSEVLWHGT